VGATATVVGGGAVTAALSAGDLVINGVSIGASSATTGTATGQGAGSAYAIAAAINQAQSDVKATVVNTQVGGTITKNTGFASGAVLINGVNIGAVAASASATTQAAAIAAAANLQSAATGVIASSSGAVVTLSAADGRDIIVAGSGPAVISDGFAAGTQHGTITLNTSDAAGITIAGAAPAHAHFTAGVTASTATGAALSTTDVLSVASSNVVLTSVDNALQQVSASGAQFGAYQNRFQAAITGLNTTATNLTSARSQIQDTDYAQATSDLSKAQILQQASTAMVAQANTVPQNVLTLLQKLP
jgi:flagellin